MNFALILVTLSAVTGGLALADRFYFSHKPGHPWFKKTLVQACAFFPVFITVLVLRSFLLEPFRIPSGSLEPTLRIGDFLLVNKFIYGLRLPVWEKEIFSIKKPHLGDIVVFRWPTDPRFDYIKRVVGCPGDSIQYHHKQLIINGTLIKQRFIRETIDESSSRVVSEYQETLNGIKHRIYIRPGAAAEDFDIRVPPHHYFMMGDNRDDSSDSRFWGFVDESYLRGKAFMVWMSWDNQSWSVRWSRIGRLIH